MKRLIIGVLKNPDSKASLKDRIKLLFKLEGLTVVAIITAVTMFFSTLGLAISNSLSSKTIPSPPGPSPPPPTPPTPGIPGRVKDGLQKLAGWLKKLAATAAAALPGIIGSIVSFILKAAGTAIGFLAEHLIILLFAVVSSIIYGLYEGVKMLKAKSS